MPRNPVQTDNKKGFKSPQGSRDIDEPNYSLTSPVAHPVTVSWGDCDPAQIAYTANIPAWGLLGIEAWYRSCLGADWYQLNLEYGVGTPFVSLNYDFSAPIKPGPPLIQHIFIQKLGTSSLSHCVEGYQDDVLCCTGTTTAAFVDARSMKPISIPPNMRTSIEHYISIQGRKTI